MATATMTAAGRPRQRSAWWQGPWARALRFALGSLSMLGALYYPHAPASWPARCVQGYVELVARTAAIVIGWGDSAARLVDDTVIDGRFPLRIVLDCTALDVQALYLSAVMAAPLSWRIKLGGALGGLVFLGGANLLRIAALYFVGAYAPGHFDVVHEDVATIVMMALACLAFAVVLTQLRDTPRAAAS